MKLKIKTLTPIHIGTGKRLKSLDFINNYRIDFDKLFNLISEENQDDFFNYIDKVAPNELTIKNLQKKFNLPTKKIISECAFYRFPNFFYGPIHEAIKDSHNKLYIPGSSIKGSLRTALIYKVLKSSYRKFLHEYLDKLINDANKIKGKNRKIKELLKNADNKLEEKVFICGVEKEKNGNIKINYNDQKYDLMKIVRINDSSSVSTYEEGEISELQVYALKKLQAHKPFKTYTESIKKNVELEFDISVDVDFLYKAKKELKNQNSEFGNKYFIGIEEKLKNLFDIDILEDENISEDKIINTIIKSWNDFGQVVSELEKKWVDSIKYKNNDINPLLKLYDIKNKFKIGFGSGFSGMTILPLLLMDESLRLKVEKFYKAVGIGFHRSTKTPLNIDNYPFTRKYLNNHINNVGFGWINIKFLNSERNNLSNIENKNKIGSKNNTNNENELDLSKLSKLGRITKLKK